MTFSTGDTVAWNTSQGTTHGRVVEMRTSEFQFEGQTFKPRADDPYYIVESTRTGAQAAHLESALRRKG
jgi:hypothetical protein